MTWGLVLRTRWLATDSRHATVTLLLSFTHFFENSAGIRLLEPRTERSAFTATRPEAMAWDPRVVALLRYLEQSAPGRRDRVVPVFYPRRPAMPPRPSGAPGVPGLRPVARPHVSIAIHPAEALRTRADWLLGPTDRLCRRLAAGRGPVRLDDHASRFRPSLLRRRRVETPVHDDGTPPQDGSEAEALEHGGRERAPAGCYRGRLRRARLQQPRRSAGPHSVAGANGTNGSGSG